MKVTGIIAEYNPFHTGHLYHLNQARKLTGADFIVVAMSGDFVQRGGPAIFDKYTRAEMALACGADLVLELPSPFAVSSAEDFASCGVALLDRLGTVDFLCFGSECGDCIPLLSAARLLVEETDEYAQILQEELKKGSTFPAARQTALERLYGESGDSSLAALVSSPNNILGLEYCKAIIRQDSPILPVTLRRQGAGYHDDLDSDSEEGELPVHASASGIRDTLRQLSPSSSFVQLFDSRAYRNLLRYIPEEVRGLFSQAKPLWPDDFSSILNSFLLSALKNGDSASAALSQYGDVSSDMALRLERLLLDFSGWEGRAAQLKTKQYTYTRINRGLTHLLLGLKKSDMALWKKRGYAPYARILGFQKSASPLLSVLEYTSRIPLVYSPAAAVKSLEPDALSMFRQDLYASHIYQCAYQQKYGESPKNEFTRKMLAL